MRLRFFTLFILMMGITFCSTAQLEKSIDSRLLAKYSEDYLNKLHAENSDHLDYLNFYIKNCFTIQDFTENKDVEYMLLKKTDPNSNKEIEINSIEGIDENFNPYLYNCEPGNFQPNYYKIGDTGKMIVMESQAALKTKYKDYKSQTNK